MDAQALPAPRSYNAQRTNKQCPPRTGFVVILDADTQVTYASFEFDPVPSPTGSGCGTTKAGAIEMAYLNFPYLLAEHGSPVFSLEIQEEDAATGTLIPVDVLPRLSGAQMCHLLLKLTTRAVKARQCSLS